MLLSKVILENYGVFRDRNEFDLSCTEQKPIVLFGGRNGAGKTTLFESIMLCLYGNSFFEKKNKKDYEEFLSHKIHRFLGTPVSADFASITVQFKFYHHGKTIDYSVTRRWHNIDGKIKEELEIKKNDSKLDKFVSLDAIEESQWQSFIEELLPRGVAKLFFFDAEKITKIAEHSGEDREIKSSFDSILGIDLVEQLQSDLQVNLMRSLSGDSKQIAKQLEEFSKQRDENYKEIGFWQEKQAELTSKIDNLKQEITELENKVSKLGGGYAKSRQSLMEKKAYLEMKLSTVENQIHELCADVLPFSIAPKLMSEIKEQLESDEKSLKKVFEKEILETNLEKLKSDFKNEEFWSEINVDSKSKESILSKINSEISKFLESKDNLGTKGLFNHSIIDSAQLQNIIVKSGQVPNELEKFALEYNNVYDEFQKVQTGLDNVPKDDEIGPLISELNSMHKNIGMYEAEINHIERNIGSNRAALKHINFNLKNIVRSKYKTKTAQTAADISEKVSKVLEEYSQKLKSEKLKVLEKYLLEFIQHLSHKEDFIEKVSINPESFEITLYNKDGIIIPKNSLAKGEQQMFATAVLWALAKTSGKPLPFIIDTPLARLDVEHRDSLIEKFYPIASHQVVIFSTNSEIDEQYYDKLKPHISRSFALNYLQGKGKTKVESGYFWDKGEAVAV